MPDELSLAELAAASGLQPRTIRSWVAQKLLPSPLNRGPMARYPAETLERLLAIRAMREILRRPLAEIRQELLVASPDALHELADKAKGLSPEPVEPGSAAVSTALDYIRGIREGERRRSAAQSAVELGDVDDATLKALEAMKAFEAMRALEAIPSTTTALVPYPGHEPRHGFEALEHQLGIDRVSPASKARAEEWVRLSITPEVELTVRGPLDPEARARLERCADLIRNILLGTSR